MSQPQRTVTTATTTKVRHVVQSFGPNRTNPPSLGQLREFVAACEGIADDTAVRLEKGSLDEGGRHHYVFSVQVIEHVGESAP